MRSGPSRAARRSDERPKQRPQLVGEADDARRLVAVVVMARPGASRMICSTIASTPSTVSAQARWRERIRRVLRVQMRREVDQLGPGPASNGSLVSCRRRGRSCSARRRGARCPRRRPADSTSPASIASSSSSTESSASAATTNVVPSHRCGHLGSTSDSVSTARSPASTRRVRTRSTPRRPRAATGTARASLEPLEDRVDRSLDHLGDDELLAVPRVGRLATRRAPRPARRVDRRSTPRGRSAP